MSPELIDPQRFGFEKFHPTKYSDRYALGMVVYETISGHLPFHQHLDFAVVVKVTTGEHPPREAGFTDSLWRMLELCWGSQPKNRPSVEDVLHCLWGVDALQDPSANAALILDELFEDVIVCDNIVKQLEGYQRIARASRQQGSDPRDHIPTKFVFKGPPGRSSIPAPPRTGF